MSRSETGSVQRCLPEIAAELKRIEQRLGALSATLPVAEHQEAMLEGILPRDVATELWAAIENNARDGLREIADTLERTGAVTAESLLDRHVAQARGFKDAERELGLAEEAR